MNDLTYVRVNKKWNYVCLLVDLFNRGNEFKNKLIHDTLETFRIKRLLSVKGCPYDNAVAEATYKIFKTEFIRSRHFAGLEELALEWNDYVNWFNNIRIHGTLGYLISVQYRQVCRNHAYDKKEQIALRDQSVQNQKEFIHQLFGLTE